MTAPFEKCRSRVVVLLLIPIAVRKLFSVFLYRDICMPDSVLNNFKVQEKMQKDSYCTAIFAEFSLCIAVLSCDRSNYFRSTVPKLFEFIAKSESNLGYEIMWIHQATEDRVSLSRLYRFDKKFLFVRPIGFLASLRLAFSQCNREYMLVLEEDWLMVKMSVPWLSVSMDLLLTRQNQCMHFCFVWQP
jgi:hypothetical protein